MVEKEKYSYDRFASKGQRVGQAVVDILSQNQAPQTVEETLDEFGRDYLRNIQETADRERKNYDGTFYIFSLLNKDLHYFGVENVLRHWTIPRKTAPDPAQMLVDYKNHTKTLFAVDPHQGEITLLWTIPSYEDCKSIRKHPESHDPQLVHWISKALSQVHPVKAS